MQEGTNALIYLGNVEVTSLSVNGVEVSSEDYEIKNNILTISAKVLTNEYNEVEINGQTVNVTVVKIGMVTYGQEEGGSNVGLIVGLSVGGGVLLLGGAIVAVVLVRRKKVGTND